MLTALTFQDAKLQQNVTATPERFSRTDYRAKEHHAVSLALILLRDHFSKPALVFLFRLVLQFLSIGHELFDGLVTFLDEG